MESPGSLFYNTNMYVGIITGIPLVTNFDNASFYVGIVLCHYYCTTSYSFDATKIGDVTW